LGYQSYVVCIVVQCKPAS